MQPPQKKLATTATDINRSKDEDLRRFLPFVTQSGGLTVFKRAELNALDACHRTQWRRFLGVVHPEHIGNQEVYESAGVEPV